MFWIYIHRDSLDLHSCFLMLCSREEKMFVGLLRMVKVGSMDHILFHNYIHGISTGISEIQLW